MTTPPTPPNQTPACSFDDWFADLQRLSVKADDWPLGDKDEWRGYWEDGYSPREAINEDMSYGH